MDWSQSNPRAYHLISQTVGSRKMPPCHKNFVLPKSSRGTTQKYIDFYIVRFY